MKKKEQKLYFFNFVFDFFLLNTSLIILLMIKRGFIIDDNVMMIFGIFNLVWLFVVIIFPYRIRLNYREHIKIELLRGLLLVAFITFILFIIKFTSFSRLIILGTILLFILLNFFFDLVIRRYIFRKLRRSRNRKRILIIGAGVKGVDFYKFLQNNQELGYDITGFLDDYKTSSRNCNILGSIENVERVVLEFNIDEVIIALPFMTDINKQERIVGVCDKYGIRLRILPDYYGLLGGNYKIYKLGDILLINYEDFPLDNFINYYSKRIFDILFSSILLIILSPILLVISICIKFDSRGSILYKPTRVGERGKKFTLFKFRTMRENDDEEKGIKSTVKDDPRMTKIGKFLRKYNLDELPQFVNILKGKMSVVGPRPHRVWLENDFQESVKEYLKRHYIKPGLTGWAQVNGWRGPTETTEQKEQRVKHDLYYIRNWTFWFDVKIILYTIFKKSSWKNAF